ncbi:MAG: hypothetical protein AAF402_17450, partial [Pseudomonadota bacterium]
MKASLCNVIFVPRSLTTPFGLSGSLFRLALRVSGACRTDKFIRGFESSCFWRLGWDWELKDFCWEVAESEGLPGCALSPSARASRLWRLSNRQIYPGVRIVLFLAIGLGLGIERFLLGSGG